MSEEKDLAPLLLEVPRDTEVPSTGSVLGSLFSDESLGMSMAKVSALESFLNASVRDCKFSEFVHEILLAILKVIKCEAGSILELDYRNESFFFRSVVGSSSDRVANFVIPLGQGIVGHVAESRLPLVVDNVPENKVHLNSVGKAAGFEARNLIAVPILIRGRVYGVLELLNRVGETNFTATDTDLLTYLCQMAGRVIEMRLMIAWSQTQQKPIQKEEAA